MEDPSYFNANAPWILKEITEFFEGVHASHEQALSTHHAYRTRGEQYGVYLRNYGLGGYRRYSLSGEEWEGQDWFVSHDWAYRSLVRQASDGRLPCLAFMNPHSPDIQIGRGPPAVIPSFRVLSHNWRDVVEEVVKGAKLVVLVLDGASEGVRVELDILQRYDLTDRTLVVVRDSRRVGSTDLGGFRHVVVSSDREDENLGNLVRSLAEDSFRQKRVVDDLSALPCHILDRNLDLAQLPQEILDGTEYEDLLPSSLVTNWDLLTVTFPTMIAGWSAIESQWKAGRSPETHEVARVMYQALNAFIVAVTLERYFEMAMSIATVGIAHRTITGQPGLMIDCYEHGALFAGWSRDLSYAAFLRKAAEELRRAPGAPAPGP